MPFVKIDCRILYSSIWAETPETKTVWITMLALADQNGIVPATAPGISLAAVVPLEATRKALVIFESPDPDSKSLENKGKRVERVEGGYKILNYESYRAFNYSMKASAIQKREYRAKHKSDNVLTMSGHSASASASESKTNNKIEKIRKEKEMLQEKYLDAWLKGLPFYLEKYPGLDFPFQWENISDWIGRELNKARRSGRGDLNLFFQRWLNKEKPQYGGNGKKQSTSWGGMRANNEPVKKITKDERIELINNKIEQNKKILSMKCNPEILARSKNELIGLERELQELAEG